MEFSSSNVVQYYKITRICVCLELNVLINLASFVAVVIRPFSGLIMFYTCIKFVQPEFVQPD